MTFPDLLKVPPARAAAIEGIAARLEGAKRVVLSTHMNADGDGCGSEVAMAHLLAQRGHAVTIVNPTPWPGLFDFLLPGIDERSSKGPKGLTGSDALLVVDISDVKRLGILTEAVRGLKVPRLVIDHHIASDDPAGETVLADTTACATGELVYDFATCLGLDITPEIATAIYVALLTDTGSFRFSNTSPRCMAIAAYLLTRGVNPEEMYQRVYASAPLGRVRILAEALQTLDVDLQAGLAWISLPAGAVDKHDVRSEDLDGIVEHARSISGTKMALFFRDLGHGKVKVSFRSTGATDVNAFARRFGGGGHAKAAGAMIPGTLEAVREQVLAEARTFLNGQDS